MGTMATLTVVYDMAREFGINGYYAISFLQSLNGVYVNGVKKEAGQAVDLSIGDKICFGSMVPMNELRYVFCECEGNAVMLKKITKFEGMALVGSTQSSSARLTRRQPPARKRLKMDFYDPVGGHNSLTSATVSAPLASSEVHSNTHQSNSASDGAALPNRNGYPTIPTASEQQALPFHANPYRSVVSNVTSSTRASTVPRTSLA